MSTTSPVSHQKDFLLRHPAIDLTFERRESGETQSRAPHAVLPCGSAAVASDPDALNY